ncbi:TPA: hypothetical protein I7717_22770 [Vibrio vulnificus]|nr:hypothetical protein [Vibrio vulnificus]
MVAFFLCFLGFIILLSSASWLNRALFSGHPFLGAKNSESCFSRFSGKHEVRASGSIGNLNLGF